MGWREDVYERDLDALRAGDISLPETTMRLRYWRHTGMPRRVFRGNTGDLLMIGLYPVAAPRGTRPAVAFYADPGVEIDDLPQESIVTVVGWPVMGRAVMIDAGALCIWPQSPCTTGWRMQKLRGTS